jgi:endonuclease-3 related protein
MVGAVLVQNTRWINVETAIRSMRRSGCLTPSAIRSISPDGLTELIRPAGCQSVKAKRLKALADWVVESGGLRRLASHPTGRLREGLLTVNGVGPESADAILCFAFNRSTFVADGYARRWVGRMGVSRSKALANYEGCRRFMARHLEGLDLDHSELHAAIVLHGQSRCGPVPDCRECVVRYQCTYPGTAFD